MAFQPWSSRPPAAACSSVRRPSAPCDPAQVLIPHGPARGARGLARLGNPILADAGDTGALTVHGRHATDISNGLVARLAGLWRVSSGALP